MQKGDLADAKGERYAALLRAGGMLTENVMQELVAQAGRQTRIAQTSGRGLKWYFAEQYAADYVRKSFERDFPDIVIATMPPRRRK